MPTDCTNNAFAMICPKGHRTVFCAEAKGQKLFCRCCDNSNLSECEPENPSMALEAYDSPAFEHCVNIAERLMIRGAANIAVYYDRVLDFVVIEFELDGNTYLVRYYKVYAVVKNRDEDSDFRHAKIFNSEYDLFNFFDYGLQNRWEVKA